MESPSRPKQSKPYRRSIFFPLLLVFAGTLFLLNNFGIIRGDLWDAIRVYWPVILIVLGLDSLFRREGLVGPIFLIGLGAVIIFYNLGYLQINVWQALLILWPVMLIAVGVDMIFGRRSLLWSMVGIGLILILLVGAFLLFSSQTQKLAHGRSESVYELSEVDELVINVGTSIGSITVEGGRQVEAEEEIVIASSSNAIQEVDQYGDRADITIADDGSAYYPGKSANEWQWLITIPTNIPSTLNVDIGLGAIHLDLGNTLVNDLTAEFGLGSNELYMPFSDQFTGNLAGGMGLIIVNIPSDLPVRINADTALVLVDVPENYRKTDSGYISNDFQSKADYAELYLNLGIGGVIIRDSNAQ
jgi:lia operon protein LiaF